MPDVLLASANFMALDSKQAQKRRPYPPLATLVAAAVLRTHGYSVDLFDAMLASDESEFVRRLGRWAPRIVVLYEDNFNFLSKMCLGRMREAAQRMAQAASARGAVVLAAGPDVTDHPEAYLPHGVSAAMVGEPDHTLVELVAAVHDGTRLADVPGVVTAERPAAIPRRPERHPDVFPMPAWDLVDVEAYRRVWIEAHGRFSVNLASTRGCPFHCNWCAKPIWGQRYAMHSPARVAEEMALVKELLRPDHVWFADDIFGLRPQWVEEFSREVEGRNARLPFTIQSRADLMTEEAVGALAFAGCEEVWLGAESGSQRILDAMDKGITVAEIREARRRLGSSGIRVGYFLQFGYPGETIDDIQATIALVRHTLPDDIGVSVSYPLPGTKFHDRVRAGLGHKTHWVDSDDLSMMFAGTYTTDFYRALHRLVHDDLRARLRGAEGAADLAAAAALVSSISNVALPPDQSRIFSAWRLSST